MVNISVTVAAKTPAGVGPPSTPIVVDTTQRDGEFQEQLGKWTPVNVHPPGSGR